MENHTGHIALTPINLLNAIQLNEERLRQLIELAPVSLLAIDKNGSVVFVNADCEHLFGKAREALLSQPFETLIPERFRPIWSTEVLASSEGEAFPGERHEFYILRADGSEIPVEAAINTIETEDGTMVLCTLTDVSYRIQQEENIKRALREKEILLSEIHHRVKNNMQIIDSLIDLQSSRTPDPETRNSLRASHNRIKSMALIHQTIYQSKDFTAVNFGLFLNSLIPILFSSFNVDSEQVKVSVDAADIRIPINLAIPCGIIVNELVSNALKHAFPSGARGEIRLKLAFDENQMILLDFSDNGVGIPDDVSLDNSKSLGLKVINLLSLQLHATLTTKRANPTRFILRFPLEFGKTAA